VSAPRVIGVSIPDVSDWRESLPAGKWSQFFRELAARLTLTGIVQPRLPQATELINLARNAAPGRARWLARAGFNVAHAERLSAEVERALTAQEGGYELIVQLQTMCTPGALGRGRPYVIYTDNTFALTQRFYPSWAPLSDARIRRWLDFEAEICRSAQRVFTYSEFARGSVIADYGCAASRVVAVGAGANQLRPTLEGKDYSRPVALFVGRPFGLKGGPTLVRAWGLVRERLPDAELLLAGPRERAPRDLGPGISWLGRVTRAQLEELYARASVFVLPTMYDAWGHVFIEAMGYGLPCIGTDCCAMPEIIADGVSGRLVPRGEPEPLAAALVELLGNPARAAEMGALAHARVLERMTWGHVLDRFVAQLPVTADAS
jgi:glycosyltransferase involved in cell wall biosynthesis